MAEKAFQAVRRETYHEPRGHKSVLLPAAADGWKRNGLQLLVIGQGQAVLHGLFQEFLTFVRTPDWAITVDHKFGRQAMASTDSS